LAIPEGKRKKRIVMENLLEQNEKKIFALHVGLKLMIYSLNLSVNFSSEETVGIGKQLYK
jgi:hypothetical protein